MTWLVDRFAEMVRLTTGASVDPCDFCDAGACKRCNGAGERSSKRMKVGADGRVSRIAPETVPCFPCRGSGACKHCKGTGEYQHPEYSFKVMATVLAGALNMMAQFRKRQEFDHMHQMLDLSLAWIARGVEQDVEQLGPEAVREKLEQAAQGFARASADLKKRQAADAGPSAGALSDDELEKLIGDDGASGG